MPFELDGFQVRALDALDAGYSVLVAAPTGSGKTVVAEYAVAKALDEGGKAFYTTPLKALSNQKFNDLGRAHGVDKVGLLTGDNSINGDAPIVVMTTEVLRNMIYAASPTLAGLRYVVLDEVHYLQDQYRGPVWEEVIIHTPPEVDLVCLSATVSNAEEFADWIQTVRGATVAIIEERRPVELNHFYMVSDRESDDLKLLPTFVDGKPNPEATKLDAKITHAVSYRGPQRRSSSALQTPRRAEVIERLEREGMLPAITFIFSRAACDEAVRQCLMTGMRLTMAEERDAIRAIAESRTSSLTDDDLEVLGYREWLAGLEAGFAAHHAGMVPPFKETVEACFESGLVKAVFATETLALGINMPARTVVIEKLSKWTGEKHEFLTPGEYTQLTGRAGRRGIDEVGYAVVLWSPFVPFDQVAGLASTRTYALTSSFRPTYNMAVNLVRRYTPESAHHLLNLSFAQYRVDRDVVRLERQVERSRALMETARSEATCELGDVEEYRRLLEKAGGGDGSSRRGPSARDAVVEALERIKPGDVLLLSGGKSAGRVAVLSTARRRGSEVRLGAITPDRRYLTLSARDFTSPPRTVAHLDLPTPFAPRNAAFQREVAQALGKVKAQPRTGEGAPRHAPRSRAGSAEAHPVADCPDVRRHVRAAERAERLEKDLRRLERRIEGRTESLARQFDRVLRVLEVWGYVDGWALTDAGRRLTRIYHESDLLVAHALGDGLFDDLDPAAFAALASSFTFQARRVSAHRGGGGGEEPKVWFPSGKVQGRWVELEKLAYDLNAAEAAAGLPLTRTPDPGFFAAVHGWASGDDLADVISDDGVTGGDFVRNMKQLIDLLRQLSIVAPDRHTADTAGQAADRLFRGVVAASSVV